MGKRMIVCIQNASEVVKQKLTDCGGRVTVYTLTGLPCKIVAESDGRSFTSDKLPIKPPYTYDVFNVIVDLLLENNGRARKGKGRSFKLGAPECDENTVVGAIAYKYAGKKTGQSVFDPVFVLSAVLEWAGVVKNERGILILSPNYMPNS